MRNNHTPNHQLHAVTASLWLDLVDGNVRVLAAHGHSDSTKGVLWSAGSEDFSKFELSEPYAIPNALLDLCVFLEDVLAYEPSTREQLDKVRTYPGGEQFELF